MFIIKDDKNLGNVPILCIVKHVIVSRICFGKVQCSAFVHVYIIKKITNP